ncbi:MAG: rhodanese [Alphaproteobacteria bacterium]|nr:rhodanese [Alphaproteobacteria bacterium]
MRAIGRTATRAALLAPLLAAAGPTDWRTSPFHDPVTLYRIDRPRSPVPGPPEGVPALDAAGVARWGGRALRVDVSPVEDGRRDPATGRWTLLAPARSIPQALWFPEAGRVPGNPAIIAHFMARVPVLAAGRPVIVFCLTDCWMSWNAALRLHRAGIKVAWYGAGRDGWAASDRPLAPVIPFVNKEK